MTLSTIQAWFVVSVFIIIIGLFGCNHDDEIESTPSIPPVIDDPPVPEPVDLFNGWEWPMMISDLVVRIPPHKTNVRIYSVPLGAVKFNSSDEVANFTDDGELISLNEIGHMIIEAEWPTIKITLIDNTWDKFPDADIVDTIIATYVDYIEMQ